MLQEDYSGLGKIGHEPAEGAVWVKYCKYIDPAEKQYACSKNKDKIAEDRIGFLVAVFAEASLDKPSYPADDILEDTQGTQE